jgi:hypothetical protein
MPFKSEKQRRYLWATNPEIAKRWAEEYPESNRNLPTYAKKTPPAKKPKKTKSDKIAYESPRNPLEFLKSSGKTPNMKTAESILRYIRIPHTDKPTAALEQLPADTSPALGPAAHKPESILNSSHEKDPNEPPFEYSANGNKAACSTEDSIAVTNQIVQEIAPILKKMGQAWQEAEQRLCRSTGKADSAVGLRIYEKAAMVPRIGKGLVAELKTELGNEGFQRLHEKYPKLIPAPHQNSPQPRTFGLNLKQLGANIKSLKEQRILAQNPLPGTFPPPSGAGSPQTPTNSSPVPTYPGMSSQPSSPAPGAVNPMLAGSNASTSPIEHRGGIKSEDGQPISGPDALLGKGNSGFTGAANLHGNEKLPNMTEFMSQKLGIPRFA